MQSYHLTQWVLFFFIYSFIGWVWECCFVSVRKHRWVNRGVMYGPMLPIYGFGALAVLLSTIKVRESIPLIFLFGMTAATLLEYVTGAVMEKIFNVRYWDYSNQKWNLHGYICVTSSLGWGLFSVLLVRIVHVPIENIVLRIPLLITEIIAFVLTIIAAIDVTQSFNDAMDMKRILAQLEESKNQIRKVQEKLKVASEELIEDVVEDYRQKAEERDEKKRFRKAAYLDRINEHREKRRMVLTELSDRVELLLTEELPAKVDELIGEERRKDFTEMKETIARELKQMNERTDRTYLRAARHLKGNPTAVSKRFEKALEDLRKFMDEK